MMQASKRTWYQGVVSFWLKDVGCAIYLIAAIITTLLCFIATGSEDLLELMIMFSIICMYTAIAWQSIRLQATEWQSLVVGYRKHVMFQGKVFIVFSNLITLLSIIIADNINLLATLTLANLVGILIWFLNRSFSHLFISVCNFSFFTTTLVCVLIEQLPVWLIPVNVVAFIVIVLFHKRFTPAYKWRPDSLVNYRNGLQSGWSPVPSGFLSNYGSSINKGLFPLSYFVGASLSQYLILIALFCAVAVTANLFINIIEHVIFVLTLLLFTIVTLCLWSKIQKQNSWELLFTLPIYNSSQSVKLALSHSALKLAGMVAIACFITVVALVIPHQELLIFNTLGYALGCAAGVLFSFAISNVCKNINLLSVFLCLSFGLNMGLANYMFENADNLFMLVLISAYTVMMAGLNRFTVRYM
ncbi:hypothetical protein [Pseudoalteromonas ostreae]|uniref:hypothetical protein n=1 Tax=Pseudoalteromonas ostreae TaxID=2774154 RepID=UPI001B36E0A1|nr:hypothetical protein [Pseudoalteromonas ostreae]